MQAKNVLKMYIVMTVFKLLSIWKRSLDALLCIVHYTHPYWNAYFEIFQINFVLLYFL